MPTLADLAGGLRRPYEPDGTIGTPYRTPAMEALGWTGDKIQTLADLLARVPGIGPTLKTMTLGDSGNVLQDMSYGMGPVRGGNMATGGVGTYGLDPKAIELANLLMPAGAVAKGAQKAGKALAPTAYEMAAQKSERLADLLGIKKDLITWHGSPHTFDRFDSSKIGTGEGKQQQGIGSYLAESPMVAQKYADKEAWKRGMDSGYLYKVDIPDDLVASMAQHEMPIAKQPANVQAGVLEMFDEAAARALKNYHGWDNVQEAPFAAVLDAIEIAKGNNRAAVADSLRKAGIPGIRYLDGGSRGAGTGTRNFVIFPGEEDALSILERNGRPIR